MLYYMCSILSVFFEFYLTLIQLYINMKQTPVVSIVLYRINSDARLTL